MNFKDYTTQRVPTNLSLHTHSQHSGSPLHRCERAQSVWPRCPGLPLLSTAALSCLLQPRLYLESLKNTSALSRLHHPSFTPALQSCYKCFFS